VPRLWSLRASQAVPCFALSPPDSPERERERESVLRSLAAAGWSSPHALPLGILIPSPDISSSVQLVEAGSLLACAFHRRLGSISSVGVVAAA
jgi:hypothetical protein